MKLSRMCALAFVGAASLIMLPASAADDRFASTLVASSGPFGPSPYNDPNAVLGKPTTWVRDQFPAPGGTVNGTVAASMVFAPYNTDPSGNKLITTLNGTSFITVKFDTPIVDDPGHWYGKDFIVYGNAFFVGNGWVYGNTDMDTYTINNGGVFAEPMQVSVSPDGISWYTYTNGPFADTAYPTQPFAWDSTNKTWGAEQDWTKPVNPALTAADFAGKTVAQALGLYDGSAGGTAFDLSESGFSSISFIRVAGVTGFTGGEIDAFSRVGFASSGTATAPEPGTLALLGLGLVLIVRKRKRG